ncbi:MAG: DUF177 domain-containing protein [Deltaproteobacteria bacterium]|nr:DUF177 domain-containing protein [Deltaproteobacteria bacterium]
MKVIIDHIQNKPVVLHIEEPLETFPVLSAMQQDKVCTFTGPIRGDITAEREYDHVRVAGRVSVPLSLSCSRCLVDYDSFVDVNFTVIFRKDTATPSVEDEIELGEEDLLSSVYQGDEIDLTHEIQEQIAMEIPLKPLCSDACKGLCHTCGTDLNVSQCTCSKETTSLAFSALKNFKVSR